jgi:nicotinamide-nucleotide amidase
MIDLLSESNRQAAGRIRQLLEQTGIQLVCAESCTAGLFSATLAQWPGISGWLCGAFVVYQTDIKYQWLGIDSMLLQHPDIGPVSKEVTGMLTLRALDLTPQANVAIAVTGHLGPGAPELLDGVVFVAIAERFQRGTDEFGVSSQLRVEKMFRLRDHEILSDDNGTTSSKIDLRSSRMARAVSHVLETLHDFLIQKRS